VGGGGTHVEGVHCLITIQVSTPAGMRWVGVIDVRGVGGGWEGGGTRVGT
jgi:hypothetical protein